MAERDVIFLVGKEEYGLDVQAVTAIEPMMDIVPVPNAPTCVLGLMNLRGEVIPVYSLRKRFELEEVADKEKNKLIVAHYDGKSIAFKVDEVLEMQDFEDSLISDTPLITKSVRTTYVRAVKGVRIDASVSFSLNGKTLSSACETSPIMKVIQEHSAYYSKPHGQKQVFFHLVKYRQV